MKCGLGNSSFESYAQHQCKSISLKIIIGFQRLQRTDRHNPTVFHLTGWADRVPGNRPATVLLLFAGKSVEMCLDCQIVEKTTADRIRRGCVHQRHEDISTGLWVVGDQS